MKRNLRYIPWIPALGAILVVFVFLPVRIINPKADFELGLERFGFNYFASMFYQAICWVVFLAILTF